MFQVKTSWKWAGLERIVMRKTNFILQYFTKQNGGYMYILLQGTYSKQVCFIFVNSKDFLYIFFSQNPGNIVKDQLQYL